eukprot:TRINITY_DN8485_c0_g3_i1.p1 TRINITY_DN8485_c0_g3~~TRINITY_DN8485_c0_g3_i1.p1  ORF type:complete len:280 (-),score=96.57 TRINITY_DN8485_c0_g3_i1:302-1141(-)
MAEAFVRKYLPKNEHIVMAWIGGVTGLTAVYKLSRPKKQVEPKKQPFEAPGNNHGTPLRLAIYAPPAGGKGTQCANITDKYGVVQFSTGDALRAQVKAGTEIGKKAKGFMDAGQLVPNDVIEEVIKSTIEEDPSMKAKGYILDGVCRTQETSEFVVKAGIMPHLNIVLDVPESEVVKRISGRRIDPVSKRSYHMTFAPPPPEIADRLIQRSDDNEVVVVERLKAYEANKAGALAPYPSDTVVHVDGLGKPEEVWARVDAVISGTKAGVTGARTRAALGF